QLGLLALEAALTAYEDVALDDVRAKSVALTEAFIELADERLAAHGFIVASPRRSAERGSHVALGHDHAYPITQALIARGVIGDFREPNLIRLGFAPLYVRHVDVWDAVEIFVDVMEREEWRNAAHQHRNAVT
nr:kynureninase [Actinomycetota bacterium]